MKFTQIFLMGKNLKQHRKDAVFYSSKEAFVLICLENFSF